MLGSIPTARGGPGPSTRLRGSLRHAVDRLLAGDPSWFPVLFVALGVLVYVLTDPGRNIYDHFVWQADAWLHGRFVIDWPASVGKYGDWYFQDVLPVLPAGAVLPFPPLPAVVLLPFVAVFGLATNAALVASLLGAVNLGLAWRVVHRVAEDETTAVVATIFYGFGTVAWYAAAIGSTWFIAHVVASTALFLAIALALDGERRPARRWLLRSPTAVALLEAIDVRSAVVGLVFGLAALARLTTIFGLPFFLLVGRGPWRRRAVSVVLGAAGALALLAGYDWLATGSLFNPAYDFLYHVEQPPTPGGLLVRLFPALGGITYHPGTWAAEDVHYLPQNLLIMLAWLPDLRPECWPGVLDRSCPFLRPDPLGMSLLLTSPAYLLALPGLRRIASSRLVAGAALATVLIAFADLIHFSQGWVQFGYRFSNDFAPFLLILVARGLDRVGVNRLTVGLVGLSMVVNAWGLFWGAVSGW